MMVCVAFAVIGIAASAAIAHPSLSGTVSPTLNTGYGYWGGIISSTSFDVTQYNVIGGSVTGLPVDNGVYWAEVGVIPKATWDYWETAYGGGFKYARFNKGAFLCSEDDGSNATIYLQDFEAQASGKPYYQYVAASGGSYDFEFKIVFDTSDIVYSGTSAAMWVNGNPTNQGTSTLEWGQDWNPAPGAGLRPETNYYGATYTDVYLVGQVWSSDANYLGSFDVEVEATPELPPSALLSLSMLPMGIAYLRGRRRKKN